MIKNTQNADRIKDRPALFMIRVSKNKNPAVRKADAGP